MWDSSSDIGNPCGEKAADRFVTLDEVANGVVWVGEGFGHNEWLWFTQGYGANDLVICRDFSGITFYAVGFGIGQVEFGFHEKGGGEVAELGIEAAVDGCCA